MKVEYKYYTENGGMSRYVEADDIKNTENVKVEYVITPYAIDPFLDPAESGLSLTVPEEIDGFTVGRVEMADVPNPISTLEEPLIKYLYIPATVRHISIAPVGLNGAELISKVEISPENPCFCVCENSVYSKDMTELYYIFFHKECFEVPAGVKRIKNGAGRGLKGLRRLTIPESVEVIGGRAFEYCPDLECAEIRACDIEPRAFCSCNSLKEVRLYDNVQKIGDQAFAYSDITKLVIPPSVRDIGHYILENADPTELTLEMYSRNSALPKMHGLPAETGTLLIIRSAETNEKLCEFVMLGKINKVFTNQEIDFEKYDEPFKRDFSSQGFGFKVGLRAAQVRLSQLNESEEEKREFFEQYIANAAFLTTLNAIIQYPNKSFDNDIKSEKYIDLVTDDDLLGLIDEAAQLYKPELTAMLMQKMHERQLKGRSLEAGG